MANRRRAAEKEAFWRKMLQQQRESELSVRDFCQRKSISEQSLYYWRKKFRGRDAEHEARHQRPDELQRQTLIPVQVVDPDGPRESSANGKQTSPWLEVLMPNGFTLRLHQHMDPQQLNQLLNVIAGCSDGGVTSC